MSVKQEWFYLDSIKFASCKLIQNQLLTFMWQREGLLINLFKNWLLWFWSWKKHFYLLAWLSGFKRLNGSEDTYCPDKTGTCRQEHWFQCTAVKIGSYDLDLEDSNPICWHGSLGSKDQVLQKILSRQNLDMQTGTMILGSITMFSKSLLTKVSLWL